MFAYKKETFASYKNWDLIEKCYKKMALRVYFENQLHKNRAIELVDKTLNKILIFTLQHLKKNNIPKYLKMYIIQIYEINFISTHEIFEHDIKCTILEIYKHRKIGIPQRDLLILSTKKIRSSINIYNDRKNRKRKRVNTKK